MGSIPRFCMFSLLVVLVLSSFSNSTKPSTLGLIGNFNLSLRVNSCVSFSVALSSPQDCRDRRWTHWMFKYIISRYDFSSHYSLSHMRWDLYKAVKSLDCVAIFVVIVVVIVCLFQESPFQQICPRGKRKSFVRELWVGGLPLGFPITLQGAEVYSSPADFWSGVSWLCFSGFAANKKKNSGHGSAPEWTVE